MMYAAYIITDSEPGIRVYSTGLPLPLDRIRQQIIERLDPGEEVLMIYPLRPPINLDGENARQSDLKFARILIHDICQALDLNVDEYYGRNQTHPYRDARCFIYKLLRENTNMSLKLIGTIHGRDHSTIINGIKIHDALIFSDLDFIGKSEIVNQVLINLFTQKNESDEQNDL